MSAVPMQVRDAASDGRVVVVGASLAGLRGAEALRQAGFKGHLTIVGAELHRPYDRPPLSKHVLLGKIPADATTLPNVVPLSADWRLGQAAVGLDRAAHMLRLADGTSLGYDRMIIATGTRARAWPNLDEAQLSGVHTLRTRDDAQALREALLGAPRRVLVIGSGFIGCEVAAACRSLDLPVTLVAATSTPMARVLGTHLGAVIAKMHEARGVDLRSGEKVERLEGDADGRVARAHLAGGGSIDADVVVVALGAVRNTEWLDGSGLGADPGGIDCDVSGRVLDADGRCDPVIYAAGDVARFPHPLYDGRRVALEHWTHAVAQGEHAGRMIARFDPVARYAGMPSFWSTQYGVNIKSVGLTDGADGLVIAHGDPRTGRFLAVYGREGRCIAAVAFDSGRWLPAYAALIEARAAFPPVGDAVDPPRRSRVMAPGFQEATS